MSHYDRNADIAWLILEGFDGQRVYSEPQDWGLSDRYREAGSLVAVEFWRASERLPKELLEALPEPEAKGVVVTREDMAKRQPAWAEGCDGRGTCPVRDYELYSARPQDATRGADTPSAEVIDER